jgi:DNA repair exonuclease SbcCD ATPase subunit
MTHEAILSPLRRLLEWLYPYRRELRHIITQQKEIDMKLSELAVVLTTMAGQITKAKDEIVAKIAELQAALADVDLPAEAQAKLDELTTLAQALDDIVPDQP